MPTPTPRVEDERRLQPRFAVAVQVTMDSEHNFYTGLTQDLSGGGLFVATHHIRPIGEVVRVNFTLPALREPIEALTQVRWVRSSDVAGGGGGPGMGLMFIELSAKAKEAIKGFLRQRDSLLFDVD